METPRPLSASITLNHCSLYNVSQSVDCVYYEQARVNYVLLVDQLTCLEDTGIYGATAGFFFSFGLSIICLSFYSIILYFVYTFIRKKFGKWYETEYKETEIQMKDMEDSKMNDFTNNELINYAIDGFYENTQENFGKFINIVSWKASFISLRGFILLFLSFSMVVMAVSITLWMIYEDDRYVDCSNPDIIHGRILPFVIALSMNILSWHLLFFGFVFGVISFFWFTNRETSILLYNDKILVLQRYFLFGHYKVTESISLDYSQETRIEADVQFWKWWKIILFFRWNPRVVLVINEEIIPILTTHYDKSIEIKDWIIDNHPQIICK